MLQTVARDTWSMSAAISPHFISVNITKSGTAEPGGGWGGFSPPTFEEDDILFCFSIFSIFYPGELFQEVSRGECCKYDF